jgi:hypothetical protein
MIARTSIIGDLDETGATLTGIEYAALEIQQVLMTILGEWFLDLNKGVPWVESILVKNPSFEYIRGILRNQILTVPGIVDVPYLVITEPNAQRTSTVTFRAIWEDGQPIDGVATTPEIVT